MLKKHLCGMNTAGFGLAAAFALLLSSGCISRSAYMEDVTKLSGQLQAEKQSHANTVQMYEAKLRDKSSSLNTITERYMALQKSNGEAQKKLNSLEADLDALLRDMAELKMVIFHNVKGSEGNEMMIKLMEMQHRVKELLRKEAVVEN